MSKIAELVAELQIYIKRSREWSPTAHELGYGVTGAPTLTLEALLRHIEGLERDAQRYNALIESGDFTPSFIEGRWGLRCNGKKASKKELDAEVDKRIAALAEQGAP